MSDNTEQVEQITKEPKRDESYAASKREKDPKRVAAGKKLAESNKRMREEHARYKAAEDSRGNDEASETETNKSSLSDGLLNHISLTNVISLVGIGLTAYAIFFKEGRAKKSGDTNAKHVEWKEPVERPEAKQKQDAKPETKSKPKFGM